MGERISAARWVDSLASPGSAPSARMAARCQCAQEMASQAPWDSWKDMMKKAGPDAFAKAYVDHALAVAARFVGEPYAAALYGLCLGKGVETIVNDTANKIKGIPDRITLPLLDSNIELPQEIIAMKMKNEESHSWIRWLKLVKPVARAVNQAILSNLNIAAANGACGELEWMHRVILSGMSCVDSFSNSFPNRGSLIVSEIIADIAQLAFEDGGANEACKALKALDQVMPEKLVCAWSVCSFEFGTLLAQPGVPGLAARLASLSGVAKMFDELALGGEDAWGAAIAVALERAEGRVDKASSAGAVYIKLVAEKVAENGWTRAGGVDTVGWRAMERELMSTLSGQAMLFGAGLHADPLACARSIASKEETVGELKRYEKLADALCESLGPAAIAMVEADDLRIASACRSVPVKRNAGRI